MQVPLSISFRNLDHSDAIEADVRKHAEHLNTLFPRITSCRVAVEGANHRHHTGNLYRVHIDLKIPGHEIAVNGTGPKDHAHEDVYVAVRDAFDAVSRRLQDHARRDRGTAKTHAQQDHGRVVKLFPVEGYGFVLTDTGDEVYFHRNAVTETGFKALKIGSNVRLTIAEGEGEKGPQASVVVPLGSTPSGASH